MCGPATHMQVGVRLVPAIVVVTTEMLQMYHFWLADSPPELWVFSTNLFTLLYNSTLHARLLSRMHTHPSKHEFHEKRQQDRLMSHGVCFSPLKWFGVSTSLTVIELSTSVGVFLQLFPHCIHLSLSLSLVLRHRNAWSHYFTSPKENHYSSTRPTHVTPVPTATHPYLPRGRCPDHCRNSGHHTATRPIYVSMWDISKP